MIGAQFASIITPYAPVGGKYDEILKAAAALGYKDAVYAYFRIDSDRWEIFRLNAARVGIYDFVKHTFVD